MQAKINTTFSDDPKTFYFDGYEILNGGVLRLYEEDKNDEKQEVALISPPYKVDEFF